MSIRIALAVQHQSSAALSMEFDVTPEAFLDLMKV
jgi:hypothetical protein